LQATVGLTTKKKGFLFYCTRYRSSPRKRDSNQELNLTLLSNEYYRFVSTLQKWVNLREKVEAKMQISHLEILLKILLFWNASTSFPCPSKMSYKPPHEDHCSGLHTTNTLLEQVAALYSCHEVTTCKTILR